MWIFQPLKNEIYHKFKNTANHRHSKISIGLGWMQENLLIEHIQKIERD